MKCRRCGAPMPEDALRCEHCGAEIRIVPDYNPLDDVLTAQVKGSIDGTETPLDDYEYEKYQRAGRSAGTSRRSAPEKRPAREQSRSGHSSSARGASARTGRERSGRRPESAGQGGSRRTEDRNGGNRQLTPEQRRRRAERMRARKKKRRLRALILAGIAAVILLILGIILYQFSYRGYMNKGNKAYQEQNYTEAETWYQKAVKKKPRVGEAYEALTDLYLAQDQSDKAGELLENAVKEYSDSAQVYEACFKYYQAIKKQGEIPLLLDTATTDVAGQLSDYKVKVPKYSLDAGETYDDVQQLSLESSAAKIYYTTDGTDPFYSDSRIEYAEPIQISEGETEIRAVSVNKNNVPSLGVSKTYTVELPIEDAPAVSPSTGQYESATQITIVVPDGYTAYYTTDGTEPTEDSEEYTGAVDMPEGSTIFKAVLINGKGRLSGVTTRNYELTTQ